jgi:hypothetical protein
MMLPTTSADDGGRTVPVDGARWMGITSVHFTSAQALRSELARAGLLA